MLRSDQMSEARLSFTFCVVLSDLTGFWDS